MYNPQELQKKAQLNVQGVDYDAKTTIEASNPPEQEENEQHWLVRGLATVGNFVTNIIQGAVKSLEGIVDAGAMLVGLFGADVDEFVNADFAGSLFGNAEEEADLFGWTWGKNLEEASYADNDSIVNQIASGVGQMLPTIALAIASGGASAAAQTATGIGAKVLSGLGTAANIASKVSFVAGAAGNASETALQSGATYGQALGYGVLSGAIEAGTEFIGGRVMGQATNLNNTLLGKLAIKTGTDKYISKGVGKVAFTFVSEGLEEVTADLLDPLNKRITGVDSEATVDWSQLPKTFVVGGSVGAILDGAQRGVYALKNKERGGRHFLNLSDSLETIVNNNEAFEIIQNNEKVTQEQVESAGVKNAKRNLDALENMSKEFGKMTEEQRKEAFSTLNESSPVIANLFETNGDLKASTVETLQEIITSGKGKNISANLTLNEREVQETLDTVNKENNYNIELSDTSFTEEQRTNFAKISKAVSGLGRKAGTGLNVAIIKENKFTNAFIEGNTMYVSEEHLADGTWVKQVAHEVAHFTENTRDFKHFAEFITEDVEAVNKAVEKIVKATDYGFTESDIRSALSKIKQGLALASKEVKAYNELVAHVTEDLLGNAESIARLSKKNTGLARKIYNKIKDIISAVKGTNAEMSTVERLHKAEKLFEKSLTAVGKELGEVQARASDYKKDKAEYLALPEDQRENWLKEKGYVVEDFADDVLDNGEEIDNDSEISYNRKANDQLWERLSQQEKAIFYQNINELNQQGYYKYKLPNGNYLFDIKNKIIETDGKFKKPFIESVVEFNDFNNQISIVKEYFYEQTSIYGQSIQESVEFVNRMFKEEVATFYGIESSRQDSRFNRQGQNDSADRIPDANRNNGERVPNETGKPKFSLKENIEQEVVGKYGKTYSWRETGYLLKDGTRVDLSGKNEGARGGSRTVDHRDIFNDYDIDGSDAMIEFMSRGNIRVSPEYPGINIQLEPTTEQYNQIQSLVENLGWREEYFSVDFDNSYGDVVDTLTYEGKVSARKVVADIRYYFKEGKVPYQSELSKFRFSLKDNPTYTLSDGQVKKKVADFTRLKVYSKVESERIINSILSANFDIENSTIRLTGKSKAEAIDALWKGLNTAEAGKRTGLSLKIADYIIDNAIMQNMLIEEENEIHYETISFLKPYLHKINLNYIKGEIKYRYDTDKSPYLLWHNKDGQTADQIALELADQGFLIKAENEADIFWEIDSAYREAVRALKKKSDTLLAHSLNSEQREELRQKIAKDILRAFDSNGKKSKLASIIEQQYQKAKVWKDLYYDERKRNSAINSLLYEVQKIRDIHFGDFQNSTQSQNLLFRGSIENLAKIKNRGDLNKSGTRRIVAGLNEWYNKENPVVGDKFVEDISYILNQVSSGDGKLTADEIRNLTVAVSYFRHFIETNNKIYRAGKYVDAKPIVEDYLEKIKETKNLKIGWAGRLFDKVFNNQNLNYMQHFNDPMTVARYMDKYSDGFFTQTLETFREGAVNSAVLEMELNSSVEEFYNKNKKFLKSLKERKITYNGVEIPADRALYLYMALNREQALMGLARSGFSYKDDKGNTVRVDGFETNEDLTLEDIKIIASEVQFGLEKQFTETDLEFVKIAEKLFNEDCKKLKAERDKIRLGYSNVVDDYYIPIRRAYIAQSVDVDSLQFELDRVSNLSFNKSAVKGAKNELFVESIDVVLSRHLRGIAQYYHLSSVIDNFNILYNMDIGGNANRVLSISSESVNIWAKGKTYMQDLISDIQGIKRGNSEGIAGKIRSGYAKFQLGANPKVWFTQLSSFFASTGILDYSSVIKGLAVKSTDVDKYCPLAKLRNHDNTAALAEGVLDKLDKFSDILMKPIGMTDRLVVKKLFGACQVQVQKNTGLKIGTEENKVKAGELLRKVILETQQNSMATERSQAMRSTSELSKTLTMFTSDSMKVIGRVIDAYGEISILKARRKATTDATERANLDKKIKSARKKAAKATSALVTSAIFMALIAQGFRTLYNKDDEDDNIVVNMTVDAVGNLFGGLPVFKDIYAKVVEGYDFDGYAYSAINDIFDSFASVIDLAGDIFSGNASSRDIASNIKKLSYAIGQLFGIPVRNVYNVFYGLTKRISPATAYKIDDIFYKQSYNADLKKAIKNNDEDMIATIAGLITNENIGSFENGATREEINRLVSADYDVLPQAISGSMTIGETQYTLTGTQKEQFKQVYNQAITAIDKLVASNGYKISTDEAKAKAIKYIYKFYYYEAQCKTLNVELDSKLYLFGQIIPIEKMALALAEVPQLTEKSINKKGTVQRYLQSAKMTSAQKYMLMGYFGYKNTRGEALVKSAINKTSLTKEQKKLLLSKCGY